MRPVPSMTNPKCWSTHSRATEWLPFRWSRFYSLKLNGWNIIKGENEFGIVHNEKLSFLFPFFWFLRIYKKKTLTFVGWLHSGHSIETVEVNGSAFSSIKPSMHSSQYTCKHDKTRGERNFSLFCIANSWTDGQSVSDIEFSASQIYLWFTNQKS